ncbi:MAG: hypothetical protein V1723_03225 [Candidatus Uhrbacteria bacterium]
MATKTKQLFDKPMDELREAFVRNRFAEPAVFGLSGIEEWLRIQRKAERPEGVFWELFLPRGFMAMCVATSPITHLRERATPYEKFPGERLIQPIFPHGHGVHYLLGALHASSMIEGVYYGHSVGCVIAYILEDGVTRSLLMIRKGVHQQLVVEQEPTNPPGAAHLVTDALFAEWNRQRPKWSAARAFLCDALAEEVKRERAKAEADFDSAVAVSADGTKIVHADWVAVWTPSEIHPPFSPIWASVRPAHAFSQRKVLRIENIVRIREKYITDRKALGARGVDGDPIRIGSVLRERRRDWCDVHHQYLLDIEIAEERRTVRCFITPDALGSLHATVCPSPLPDGGVEVTV